MNYSPGGPSPGDVLLDKYRIEALVGAEVFRVTHVGLNVTRAVKVLRRDAEGVGSMTYSDMRWSQPGEQHQCSRRLALPILNEQLLKNLSASPSRTFGISAKGPGNVYKSFRAFYWISSPWSPGSSKRRKTGSGYWPCANRSVWN